MGDTDVSLAVPTWRQPCGCWQPYQPGGRCAFHRGLKTFLSEKDDEGLDFSKELLYYGQPETTIEQTTDGKSNCRKPPSSRLFFYSFRRTSWLVED